MQTFLPYPDFVSSAKCLDSKRLGKQRSEVLILVRSILGHYESGAWGNHPVTKMWQPYLGSLIYYGRHVCDEWRNRDFKDSTLETLEAYQDVLSCRGFEDYQIKYPTFDQKPDWLGWERLHASHRSNLLRKDAKWYGQFGWTEGPALSYFYPV